jgi:hypothetical protein
MPTAVVGRFHLALNAEHAIRELENLGFGRSETSLTAPGAYERALAVLSRSVILHTALSANLPPSTGEPEIQAAHLRTGARSHTAPPPSAPQPAGGFEELEEDWRRGFRETYQGSGYRYEQLAPAYRYGAELALSRFADGQWERNEPAVHEDWEQRNPYTWEQASAAIQYAWESARELIQTRQTSSSTRWSGSGRMSRSPATQT